MLRKWFLILTTLALSAFLLVACDATSPSQTIVPANTPQAVTFPALRTSGRTMLVYFLTSRSSSTDFTDVLRRYDINTRQSVDVLKLPNIKIEEAQISADGQWILYVAYVIDHDELRLVRIDGRYTQTLLSAPPYAGISNVQWSPDQKRIAFAEQPPQSGPLVIYLLTLAQRHIQSELTSASQVAAPQYVPREWLDNTRLLVTDMAPIGQGSAFQHLALLDTRKGGHQQPGDLQALYNANGQCGDYATGADATQLFLLNCSVGTLSSGSSTISVQPLSGGTSRPIFHSSTLSITQIRQFTPQSLLLISKLTVWSIHNDGTGLTQLFGDSDQHGQENFCQFSRSSWSNFARDGHLLALVALRVGVDTHATTLVIGSPGGGSLQTVTSGSVGVAGSGADVYLVGWTTL